MIGKTYISFVLWVPEYDVEYIAQQEAGDRQVGTPEPSLDGPASRLSTIVEEPSDLTEDTMFMHDEPNLKVVYLEAAKVCLRCADDGKVNITEAEPADSSAWGTL